jgi:hypothetical protein
VIACLRNVRTRAFAADGAGADREVDDERIRFL